MAIRKTIREEKSERNQRRITDTAALLFNEHGFERVTVDDICEQANVSKSTFYTHFNSKQDLLMLFSSAERSSYLSKHYAYDETVPFKDLFRSFCFANFSYNRSKSREWNQNIYISYIKTFRQDVLLNHFYQDELRRLIQRGMLENAFRNELTAQEHFHMIHDWIVGFFIGWSLYPDDTPNIEATYDNIMNAMINALIK